MNACLGSAASAALDALDARGYAIVDGAIGHRRTRPVENAFRYPVFCLRLPLSRLAELPARGIALDRRGAISFHQRDHGPCDGSPLLPWIRARLAREGVDADGEVVLHAFPRMLGYAFNPVSFWVAYDRRGAARAVLAQVNNTFGERHEYLVARADGQPIRDGEVLEARKAFHVSPFCEVRGRYAFRFDFGGARWLARIDYFDRDDAAPLLETWISGRAAPLEPATVRRLLWRYRWFTLGVVVRIHWQAFKLWRRHVPWFAKPAPPGAAMNR